MKRVSWVIVLALALAGCGATAQPASQPPPPTATSAPAPAKVPDQLKFTAKTLDGKDFAGESLAGKRVVFWFWTPWCPRCQGEAEDIVAAARETEGRVQFVGVAAQAQVSAMQRFVDERGLGFFPHIADADGAVWKRFGVVEQPSHAFIKADGTVDMVLRQLPTDELLDNVRLLTF
jgi:peroxiredoxin